jgi:hypothetical protein
MELFYVIMLVTGSTGVPSPAKPLCAKSTRSSVKLRGYPCVQEEIRPVEGDAALDQIDTEFALKEWCHIAQSVV